MGAFLGLSATSLCLAVARHGSESHFAIDSYEGEAVLILLAALLLFPTLLLLAVAAYKWRDDGWRMRGGTAAATPVAEAARDSGALGALEALAAGDAVASRAGSGADAAAGSSSRPPRPVQSVQK